MLTKLVKMTDAVSRISAADVRKMYFTQSMILTSTMLRWSISVVFENLMDVFNYTDRIISPIQHTFILPRPGHAHNSCSNAAF